MMDKNFPQPPKALYEIQKWFGKIITQPLVENSHINPIAPTGKPIEEEAQKYILPSPTLKPYQRIELYNQQYWWRLLRILHDTFPMLTRLFGYTEFNQKIGVPFLKDHIPSHWSLNFLGSKLTHWIEQNYHEKDRELIIDATALDWAFNYAFIAAKNPSIDEGFFKEKKTRPNNSMETIAALLKQKLYLQPHIFLFCFDYNLIAFRQTFIEPEDGDYWLTHPFPDIDNSHLFYFILFRNKKNLVAWNELSLAQYDFLKSFEKGCSIEEACDRAEYDKEACENLHLWIQDWVLKQWFTKIPPQQIP